ncbi:hypothetical protein [Vibrio campbellii]|uniref:hypothetical protein n=1 Tax=Vibrio campbellii TaxID=680 RepID=UPI001F2E89C0|nr:hypothetical protein [Vibrio campbellii]MCE7729648.1 hypothetical protein [Vibrio campbellii]
MSFQLITDSDWPNIQRQLESPYAHLEFKYKGQKITVVREYKNESQSKLGVYIDGCIKGEWIEVGSDTIERPDVIDDVWFLKTQAKYDRGLIKRIEKIRGKRKAKEVHPDLHDKHRFRWPWFNKASSLVRQFKKLEGIELCR